MLTYLLPLRTADGEDVRDLAAYLRVLAATGVDVLVVDGSGDAEIARHRELFGTEVRVLPTEIHTVMGKVGNVLTGLRYTACDKVVIADDDVRYTPVQLRTMSDLLDDAEVVRPQNYYTELPWHARVDTARTLLARISGGDWPGTLGVRRNVLLATGGYADVMFENLELVRTVRAAGGRERLALDLLVARTPPTTSHFASQQIRQACDEFARPARLCMSLLALPLFAWAIATRRRRAAAIGTAVVVAAAETGRRRAGGARGYAPSSVLLAPPWLLWRSLCSWAALGARLRGGVHYRGRRIPRAATPARARRRESRASSSSGTRRSPALRRPARRTAAAVPVRK